MEIKKLSLAEHGLCAGDLILDKEKTSGIIYSFEDSAYRYAKVHTLEFGPFGRDVSKCSLHPWDDVFQIFAIVSIAAGQEPEKYQELHDSLIELLEPVAENCRPE
jgi:hypothetical protein